MQKVEIHRAESGGFVFITPQKCLQIPALETVLSEVRSFFRQDNSKQEQHEPCPYCGSANTIGHGLRETSKQVLTRRFCNSCNKTWVSGRELRIVQSTKTQVAFLKLLDYSEKDISESVHRSKSTVRAHIENIEIAEYRALQNKAKENSKRKGAGDLSVVDGKNITELDAGRQAVIEKSLSDMGSNPTPSTILAPEFDRVHALKERIGNFTVWNYNGRLAASAKGKPEPIFLAKDGILHMKTLRKGRQGKQELSEYLSQLPEEQRDVVRDLIETLIDEDNGCFMMLRAGTRAEDAEIDADDYERGRFGGE